MTLPGEYVLELCSPSEAAAAAAGDPSAWLGPEERALWGALTVDKRRRDWAAGRLAAKRAALRLLDLPEDPLSSVQILNRPSGQPFIKGAEDVSLSLSHSEKGGIAAAKWGPGPIGIDWETVAEREPRVLSFYVHESERPDNAFDATRLWTVKEAVLKFLGVGLGCDPRDVRLAGGSPELHGPALEAWQALGQPALRLDYCPWGDALIAVAY